MVERGGAGLAGAAQDLHEALGGAEGLEPHRLARAESVAVLGAWARMSECVSEWVMTIKHKAAMKQAV